MTLKDILNQAVTTEDFNTNNGWGFGGAYGKMYTFANGVYIRKGKACYRHTGTSPFIAVYKDGERIMDVATLSKTQVAELAEMIK